MRLIGIAGGSKRSGKSTAANFIFANELKALNIIEKFEMDEEGKLYVNHGAYEDETNKIEAGMSELNMDCRDIPFLQYLAGAIWPHVKIYSFAELLKFICVNMYGLAEAQVYGSTEDKESLTKYTYRQLKKIVPGAHFPKKLADLDECVVARKFVQYMADTLRELNDDCFLDPLMKQIEVEQVPLSIIGDVRRKKEVEAIQAAGGKVIFLNRVTMKDNHRIENEFSDIEDKRSFFDIVIDSQDMTIAQKNIEIYTELKSVGWF